MGTEPINPHRSYTRQALFAMLGFGLVIGVVFPFAVDPFVAWVPGRKILFSAMCLAAGLMVGGVAYLITSVLIVGRVRKMVGELRAASFEAGDLTGRITVESNDFIGEVAYWFNESVGNLQSMVAGVRGMETQIEEACATLEARNAAILDVIARYRALIDELDRHFQGLDDTLRPIFVHADELSTVVGEGSSAILEQDATIQEIDAQADDVIGSINRTVKAASALALSVQTITGGAGAMSSSAGETLELAENLARASERILGMVGETNRFSREVTGESGTGLAKVQGVIDAIAGIEAQGRESVELLENLRTASASVEEIIATMRGISAQTSLLALNASIIASASGEEGRAFGVVASEIRALAGKAAASTQDVAAILGSIKTGVEKAAGVIEQSQEEIVRSVDLSSQAGIALERIVSMIGEVHARMDAINELSGTQTADARKITEAMNRVSGMAGQIAAAAGEQDRGTRQVNEIAARMQEVALLMKRALAEQRTTSRQISAGTERTLFLIRQVVELQRGHARRMEDAKAVMAKSRDSVGEGERIAGAFGDALGRVKSAFAGGLDRLRRFRV